MTMITPSYLGETIEYSSLHACRSTLEDPTSRKIEKGAVDRNDQGLTRPGESKGRRARITKRPQPEQSTGPCRRSEPASDYKAGQDAGKNGGGAGRWRRKCMLELM